MCESKDKLPCMCSDIDKLSVTIKINYVFLIYRTTARLYTQHVTTYPTSTFTFFICCF